MPLTSSATDAFGIGTLVLVILCCIAGTLISVYVVFFHVKVGKERLHPLRDFDSPWVIRIVLIIFSVLWSLDELFRLPWLRKGDGFLHSLDWKSQANLCRFHVVWSLGIVEPGFLLAVLFLFQVSLHHSSALGSLNGRVLKLMGLFCSPVFILQLLLVLTTHNENLRTSVPSYFTKSFEVAMDATNTERALCTYPLFSILLLGLFSAIFVFYFSYLGMRMLAHVINRRLQMRVYCLVLAVMVLLPSQVLFLGFSMRSNPSESAHQLLMFLGFLALLLCTTGAMCILVVLPVADAVAVNRIIKEREQGFQSCSITSIEPFGRSLSGFVSDDDDESPGPLSRRSLLGAVSITGTDAGSSRRSGSLSLETNPKDLTLGPGGWLVDVPGSMASPFSSALIESPFHFPS